MQDRLLASGIFLVEAPNGGDRYEAVTSRIDFTRISESWSDAKHDATIPPATASRLHFLPFPYTFFTLRVLESTYLRRTNTRKHPGNDRRPRLVLCVSSSLAICSPFLLRSLWSFTVCPGLKCAMSRTFPYVGSILCFRWWCANLVRLINFPECDFNRFQCSRFGFSWLSIRKGFSWIFPGIFFKVLDSSSKILTIVLNKVMKRKRKRKNSGNILILGWKFSKDKNRQKKMLWL